MKKLTLILLPLLLAGCDGLSSKKAKTITELTAKLSLESQEAIIASNDLKEYPFAENLSKYKSYKLSNKKIISSPIIANNIIYAIDDSGTVIAFSKVNKKILWTQNISNRSRDHNHIGGGIAYNSDKLFITNGSRFLIVLNSKTGHELFRKEFSDIIRIKPIMLDQHTVFIQTISNQVYAYDFYNSKFIWQHEGMFETLTSSTYTGPILYNSNILVSYSSGQVISLNAKNGQENWNLNLSQRNSNSGNISLPNFDPVTSSCAPVIEGNNVYIASSAGIIAKVDFSTGQILWQIQASDVQSMAIEGNSLFITNNAKQVSAISTNTGKVKWLASIDLTKDNRSGKSIQFLQPMISKKAHGLVLSIVASNANIYNFEFEHSSNMLIESTITKGLKNVNYINVTCCGDTYIVTDKQITFIEKTEKPKAILRKK
ncbi:MAG: PQQ-binding-like beta-propeller repeat protein [Janthinobacterium lividum]